MAQGSAIGASHGHLEADISDLNHVGNFVHVEAGSFSAVAVNSLTFVTVETVDITGVAAGDLLIARIYGTVLNDSGAQRLLTIQPNFDGQFTFEHSLFSNSHATNRTPFWAEFRLTVRDSSNADAFLQFAYKSADPSGPGDVAGFSDLSGWDTVAADLTGTVTVDYKVKSNDVAATQEMLLYSFTVEKLSST